MVELDPALANDQLPTNVDKIEEEGTSKSRKPKSKKKADKDVDVPENGEVSKSDKKKVPKENVAVQQNADSPKSKKKLAKTDPSEVMPSPTDGIGDTSKTKKKGARENVTPTSSDLNAEPTQPVTEPTKIKKKNQKEDNEPKKDSTDTMVDKKESSKILRKDIIPKEESAEPRSTSASSTHSQPRQNVPINQSLAISSQDAKVIFIEKLDSVYECVSCGQPLRVPFLFEDCGHRCCSVCVSEIFRTTSKCPMEGSNLKKDKVQLDRSFQTRMDMLGVRCSYCNEGCSWTGILAELGSHLNTCKHKIVICPYQCGVEFEKRYLDKHLSEDCPKRHKKCSFCDAKLMAANELKHIAVCPKFPVPCPNGCKKHEVPRSLLAEHLATECSKQEMPCPFAQHGCEFYGRKKKIDPHVEESVEKHLTILNKSVQQMSLLIEAQTKSFTELRTNMELLSKRITSLERCFGASFVWKIENYNDKLNNAKSGKQTSLFSPPFYTHRYGYRLALSVSLFGNGDARGKYMSVYACICHGEHDALLPWPFTHQLTFTLIDQHTEVSVRKPIEYTIRPSLSNDHQLFLGRPTSDRNSLFGAPRFCKLEALQTSNYILDDAIYIKVTISLDHMPPI